MSAAHKRKSTRGSSLRKSSGKRGHSASAASVRKTGPTNTADFPYRLTHPGRVVYPESDITKGDVARYYLAVGDRMLPHVAGRLLSMVRCPEGVGGQCFYQKHPPMGLPDKVRRVRVREK